MTPENGTAAQLPAELPSVYFRSNAKVNLGLFIKGKRPDGYHELETVFLPVQELYDDLSVSVAFDVPEPVLLLSGRPLPSNPAHNLVLQAYRLLKNDYPDLPAVRIRLHKRIPPGSGLGGGSSNAAFFLKAIDELLELKLPPQQLHRYALQLGADVPFFLLNTPTLATGIGEVLEPLELNFPYRIQVVLPTVFSETAAAYRNLDLAACNTATDLRRILSGQHKAWPELLHNDFEPSVFARFPQLAAYKQALYDKGAVYASLSGSGSALYGLFPAEST